MNRNVIVHCTSLKGHHLEYLHHIYMAALSFETANFFFILPSIFEEKKNLYNWPASSHVIIEHIDGVDQDIDNCGIAKKGLLKVRNLKKYIRKYKASDVVLIDMMSYMPFLPILVSSSIRVHGILYRIYLYDWQDSYWLKRVADVLKYLLFSRFSVFSNIYILNDSTASNYLNKLYKTSKFNYLPDPIASFMNYTPKGIRSKYNILTNKTVYLHPGGMLPYKGSLEILRALDKTSPLVLNNVAVIFAGRVTPYIKDAFFELYERVRKKVQIVLIEGFLPFEDLADLFHSCDYVLIPYQVKCQSSGIVGHSAFYNKPVIVAKGGVVGKMVRKWHLGPLLEAATVEEVSNFFCYPQPFESHGEGYVKSHSVDSFCEVIFKDLD